MEDWHSDIAQSEVYTGVRAASFNFTAPATGNIGASIGLLGRGLNTTGTSAYFTSPTAQSTSAPVTAVNGVLRLAGAQQTVVTGIQFAADGGMTTGQVIGSNFTPDVFVGPITVSGSMSAYFDTVTLRDAYKDESIIAANLVAYAGTAANAEFLCFTLPALKITSRSKPDNPSAIIQSFNFVGGYNSAGGATVDSEATSLWTQDSLAV
jgi:hypothetical protein